MQRSAGGPYEEPALVSVSLAEQEQDDFAEGDADAGSPRLALTAALDRMPVAVYPQVRSRIKDASAGQTRACAPCSGPLSCACRYRWEAFDN